MENLYKKTYTSKRESSKIPKTSSSLTPPPKSSSKPEDTATGSHSAPPKFKRTANRPKIPVKQPKKSVTFAETDSSTESEQEVKTTSKTSPAKKPSPAKKTKAKSERKKEKEVPAKRKRSRVSKDFGSGKPLKKNVGSDAEKGKTKVFGSEPEPVPASSETGSLFGSESSSDTSTEEERPLKKMKAADLAKITVPESVARLFSNIETAASFVKNYTGKVISPLKYLDIGDLLGTNLQCVRELEVQGLKTFLEFKHIVYPELVKVFYCNLTIKKSIIRSKVKGKSIKITLDEFREYFRIVEDGPDTSPHSEAFNSYNRFNFYASLCKPEVVGNLRPSKHFKTGPLTAENRLLHYFITYLVAPRGCNHAVIMDSDLYLMFAFKHKVQLNWGQVFARHMKKSRHLQYLPFGFHISYLLTVAGVDVKGETSVSPKTIALIDRASLGKLDLGWNIESGTFDYVSDTTMKVRRPHKPRTSSSTHRQRSQTPLSLIEKVDNLTKLVEENRKFHEERYDRLEALILSLIPSSKQSEAEPSSVAPKKDEPSESVPKTAEVNSDEGGTEPLVIETETEKEVPRNLETEAEDSSDSTTESEDHYKVVQNISTIEISEQAEGAKAAKDEANVVIDTVLADLNQTVFTTPLISDLD